MDMNNKIHNAQYKKISERCHMKVKEFDIHNQIQIYIRDMQATNKAFQDLRSSYLYVRLCWELQPPKCWYLFQILS